MVGEGVLRLASRGAGGLENTHYDHTHTPKKTHKDALSQLIYSNADFLCKGHGKQTKVLSTSLQVAEVQLCPMAHGNDGFCWRPQNVSTLHYRSYRFWSCLLISVLSQNLRRGVSCACVWQERNRENWTGWVSQVCYCGDKVLSKYIENYFHATVIYHVFIAA